MPISTEIRTTLPKCNGTGGLFHTKPISWLPLLVTSCHMIICATDYAQFWETCIHHTKPISWLPLFDFSLRLSVKKAPGTQLDDLKLRRQLVALTLRAMSDPHSLPGRTAMYSTILILMISQWPSMVSACRRPSPVNCKWGRWNWQSCDVTCGGGTQSGTRRVIQQAANGGRPCSGPSRATRTCNSEDCPGFAV